MAKAMVIYGSTTGNTESTAHIIARAIANNSIETTIKDVRDVEKNDFSGDYDILLMGCSTWGDEEIELQEDFAEFYEDMDSLPIQDRKVAVFGCGDSSYTYFCGAVDALEEKSKELGANLVVNGLKIDGDPEDMEGDIVEWATSAASHV
jgi:flavodoxin I